MYAFRASHASRACPMSSSAIDRTRADSQNESIGFGNASVMHIVVVGAGIIGLTSAQSLLEAGHHVTVIDSANGPASGTSHRNGAQMSYAFVAPLASADTLRSLPSLLLDRQSPLRFRPGLSPAIWQWC